MSNVQCRMTNFENGHWRLDIGQFTHYAASAARAASAFSYQVTLHGNAR
jgi:hypothetical protein